MHRFKQLEIWKRSTDLCVLVYQSTTGFPTNEKYGLTSQIRRSTVSIPSNIAEGSSRSSIKDFSRFLEIALGSAFELETQLLIANRLDLIDDKVYENIITELTSIVQMTTKFKSKLRT